MLLENITNHNVQDVYTGDKILNSLKLYRFIHIQICVCVTIKQFYIYEGANMSFKISNSVPIYLTIH